MVERGYELLVKDEKVTIRPIDRIDQNYQNLGDRISRLPLSIDTPSGPVVYEVSYHDGGVNFKPMSSMARTYIEDNRATVIKEGLTELYGRVSDSINKIRTIFIDLK